MKLAAKPEGLASSEPNAVAPASAKAKPPTYTSEAAPTLAAKATGEPMLRPRPATARRPPPAPGPSQAFAESLPGMRATRSTFGRQVVAVRQSAPSFSFGGTGGRFGNPAGRSVSLVARPPRNASPAAAERPSVERTFVAASPGPIYLLNDLTGQALAYTLARRPPSIFEPRQSGPSRYLRTPSARRSRPASAAPEQQGARTTAQARAHARPASAVASRRYDDAIDPSGGFTFGSRAGFKPLAHCESVDAFYELESTLGRARSQSAFASAPVAAWAGSRLARFERPERATARALPGPAHYADPFGQGFSSFARAASGGSRPASAKGQGFGSGMARSVIEPLAVSDEPGPASYAVSAAGFGRQQESVIESGPRFSLGGRPHEMPRAKPIRGALGPGPGAYVV